MGFSFNHNANIKGLADLQQTNLCKKGTFQKRHLKHN